MGGIWDFDVKKQLIAGQRAVQVIQKTLQSNPDVNTVNPEILNMSIDD